MTREESAGVPSLFRLCGNDGQSETPIYMPELRLRHLSLAGAVRRLRRVEHAGRRGGRGGLFGQARPQPRWAPARARNARRRQQNEIGRESCREREGRLVEIWGVTGTI